MSCTDEEKQSFKSPIDGGSKKMRLNKIITMPNESIVYTRMATNHAFNKKHQSLLSMRSIHPFPRSLTEQNQQENNLLTGRYLRRSTSQQPGKCLQQWGIAGTYTCTIHPQKNRDAFNRTRANPRALRRVLVYPPISSLEHFAPRYAQRWERHGVLRKSFGFLSWFGDVSLAASARP